MRRKPTPTAERSRIRDGALGSDASIGNNGAFVFHTPWGELHAIVADGDGWDHVSVTAAASPPVWGAMVFVRNVFFKDEEWPIQYGPGPVDNINEHPFCLHWWRPQGVEIPRPPTYMV